MTKDIFGIEEEVENHFRSLQDVSAAHPHQPIVQEQNPPVNGTSLSNHHEDNTVHEEHPPVAENTPPPPAEMIISMQIFPPKEKEVYRRTKHRA